MGGGANWTEVAVAAAGSELEYEGGIESAPEELWWA